MSFLFVVSQDAKSFVSKAPQDECDVMVPGQQLWHPAPPPPGDDLRGPGGLWTHAAGESALLSQLDATVEKTIPNTQCFILQFLMMQPPEDKWHPYQAVKKL